MKSPSRTNHILDEPDYGFLMNLIPPSNQNLILILKPTLSIIILLSRFEFGASCTNNLKIQEYGPPNLYQGHTWVLEFPRCSYSFHRIYVKLMTCHDSWNLWRKSARDIFKFTRRWPMWTDDITVTQLILKRFYGTHPSPGQKASTSWFSRWTLKDVISSHDDFKLILRLALELHT